MAKLSALKSDEQKEREGVWVPYAEDVELKIARSKNRDFRQQLLKLVRNMRHKNKKFSRMRDEEAVANLMANSDEFREKLAPAIADHILIDWKNVEDENGEQIKYTPEYGKKILAEDAYEDLFNFILDVAGDAELYRTEEIADDAKNL